MSSKVAVFTILLFALPGTISCAIDPIRVDNGPRPSQTTRNWHVKEETWR